MSLNDNQFANRTNDPIRVFLDSKNAYREHGSYRFYLELDSFNDTFDINFQVRRIQCTYSWHNVNSSNNHVSLNSGASKYTVPPGNYSIQSLISELNANMGTYTFAFNEITGKVSVTGASTFTWDVGTTINSLLGWSALPAGSSTTFTSPGLPDVSPIKAINFHLQTVPARSFALYPSVQYSRLVGTLFVGNAVPYTTIEVQDETLYRESSIQHSLRLIDIAVLDQSGSPVDLQNGSFQMLMEFSFRPKKVVRLTDYL